MGVITNAKDTIARFSGYIGRLSDLCKSSGITGSTAPLKLVKEWKSNREFQEEWNKIWTDLISTEGGKVSVTTVSIIIGAVFGGVGVTAFGGAIGLPLAAVLAPVGYTVGNEMDDHGWTQKLWRWITRKGSSNSDSPIQPEILLQAGADIEALAITVDDLSSRCDSIEKTLSDISRALTDHGTRIESLKAVFSATEQRISILTRQLRILKWICTAALLFTLIAVLAITTRFHLLH